MTIKDNILKKALVLPVQEKSELIDALINSLVKPDAEIDDLWKSEAENRIDAYDEGKISSVTLKEAVAKFRHLKK